MGNNIEGRHRQRCLDNTPEGSVAGGGEADHAVGRGRDERRAIPREAEGRDPLDMPGELASGSPRGGIPRLHDSPGSGRHEPAVGRTGHHRSWSAGRSLPGLHIARPTPQFHLPESPRRERVAGGIEGEGTDDVAMGHTWPGPRDDNLINKLGHEPTGGDMMEPEPVGDSRGHRLAIGREGHGEGGIESGRHRLPACRHRRPSGAGHPRPLIDPQAQQPELRGRQRHRGDVIPRRWHDRLATMGGEREEQALLPLFRHDRRAGVAAGEDLGPRLQNQIPLPLRTAVAGEAIPAQDREDVALEHHRLVALHHVDHDRLSPRRAAQRRHDEDHNGEQTKHRG